VTDQELKDLVIKIKQQHSVALYRMRNYLNTNIIAALSSKGAKPNFDNNGFISALNQNGDTNFKIWATPRPPKVNDYHYLDNLNPIGEKMIVGPEFMEEKREIINSWLSQKAKIHFYNEGQIQSLIDLIYS
jgi:hypothetical protein